MIKLWFSGVPYDVQGLKTPLNNPLMHDVSSKCEIILVSDLELGQWIGTVAI